MATYRAEEFGSEIGIGSAIVEGDLVIICEGFEE